VNGLDLGVVLECVLSQFATLTALLVTAEGYVGLDRVVRVDPYGTRFERIGQFNSARQIFTEDSSRKTIVRVIRRLDEFVIVVEFGHDSNYTKRLSSGQ
jgi:hypothetical protein